MKLANYIKITVSLAVIITCFVFADSVIKFLFAQLNVEMITRRPSDGFILYIQIAMLMSAIVLFPLIVHQVVQYVRPALHDHEKVTLNKLTRLSMLISGLFILGVTFGYYILMYMIIPYLSTFNESLGITNIWNASETVVFVLSMMLYTGITFQTPIVVYYSLEWEILDFKQISLIRKILIIVALVISSIITPPDVISQVVLSMPIWVLFEISVLYWRLKKWHLEQRK